MTISPPTPADVDAADADWPDDVVDLTDRRRILLLAVLGVDVPGPVADAVFAPVQPSSSTTMRSGGRSSSTDDR